MSAPTPPSEPVVHSPVVLHDGQWRLVSGAGAILATDPVFTSVLDKFATALAAADQAVAELRPRENESSATEAGGQR
jgi:hypothetical protein